MALPRLPITWAARVELGADKGPGVVFGLVVRAEDSDSRSDSQENDSRPLIGPAALFGNRQGVQESAVRLETLDGPFE